MVRNPITVAPETTLRELLKLMVTYSISGIPVIENDQLVGIVTHRDIRFEENLDQPASEVMTPKEKLITAKEQATSEEIIDLLHRHRLDFRQRYCPLY